MHISLLLAAEWGLEGPKMEEKQSSSSEGNEMEVLPSDSSTRVWARPPVVPGPNGASL